jgi:hypothetical protein
MWLERYRPATLALSVAAIAAVRPSAATATLLVVVLVRDRRTFEFWRHHDAGRYVLSVGRALVVALLATAATSTVTGVVAWVGDNSAGTVLTQLIAIELVLGVIPLAAAATAVQVAAGRVSLAAVRTLRVDAYVTWPISLVVVALALDMVLLPIANGFNAQMAALVGAIAIATALVHAREMILGLDTGALGAMAVRRLSLRWLQAVRSAYDEHGSAQLIPGDPFATVERLLVLATAEHDARGFDELVARLLDRIDLLAGRRVWITADIEREGVTAEDEVVLDDYLARRLRALIQHAGSDGEGWVLDALRAARRQFSPGQTTWTTSPAGGRSGSPRFAPALLARAAWAGPTGTRLVTEIARAGIHGAQRDTTREAIRALGHYWERVVEGLPANGDDHATRDHEMSFWEFNRLYEQLVTEIVARGMSDILPDLAWDTAFRISHLRYHCTDLEWVRRLGQEQHMLWRRIVDIADDHSVCAVRLNADFWDLEHEGEVVLESAGWMAACAAHGLRTASSRLDFMAASECTRLTRHIVAAMPQEAGTLTRLLEDVATKTRARADAGDEEARLIVKTIDTAVSSIKHEAEQVAEEFKNGYEAEAGTHD